MKITFFLIVVTVSLFLLGACGEVREKQPMGTLTKKKVEMTAKEIIYQLEIFKEREDIQALSKAIVMLKALNNYERPDANQWPSLRKDLAALWIRVIQVIDIKVDKAFNFNDVPTMNIAAPGSYPSGIASESISNPELRKQYEQAIESNSRKANKYMFQYKLKSIKDSMFQEAEDYLVALYSECPEEIGELKKLLYLYESDKLFESRIDKRLTAK